MKNACITYGKDTIESQGLSFYLNVLQTAYFKLLPADKGYRVNLLACLHMARGYCVEGSVYRQEIDALHAKVWADLEKSLMPKKVIIGHQHTAGILKLPIKVRISC